MDFKPHRIAIRTFLDDARRSGVTDAGTHTELVHYLDTRTGMPIEDKAPQTPPAPPRPPKPTSVTTRGERPTAGPEPRPTSPPEPLRKQAPEPPRPRRKGELSRRFSAIRNTVISDLSLHGFAYLGVLVIFACVLGLLLFAFADIPDAHQPIYELVIALVFFVFAWYLRRQGAVYVARAMELIGGMALPLVIYAGLVDGAPIPPDFEGTALIGAMIVVALVLSGAYSVWSARHEESVLGYLVAPLWWLAALTLGFAFKTDEPLTGDAITRLISHQPALAAVAVAMTVFWISVQPGSHLAARTRVATFVGVPLAYLLTISLAASEGWGHSLPLFLAGAATFLSTELLVRSLDKSLVNIRPFLLAALIAPMLPDLDAAVAGILIVASYTALFEWTARTTPEATTALTLARAGMGLGAALTLGDARAALFAFTLISVWAHYHRLHPASNAHHSFFTLAAAVAPVGVGFAVAGLIPGAAAWAVMAAVLLVVAAAARVVGSHDNFWAWWAPAAAVLVAAGVLETGTVAPDPWRITALGTVAVTLAVGPRWEVGRIWAVAAATAVMLGDASHYVPNRQVGASLAFAVAGIAVLAFVTFKPATRGDHLAGVGHCFTAIALFEAGSAMLLDEAGSHVALAIVAMIWTLGWALSTLASLQDGESLTSLLTRLLGPAGWLVPPVIAAASIPGAAVLTLRLWPPYAAEPAWIGATFGALAVAYALGARALAGRASLARIAAIGGVVLVVIAPILATPERLPLMAATAAGVAVAVALAKTLESRLLSIYGWASGHALALLLAEQAGVATRHLGRAALVLGLATVAASLLADDRRAGRRDPGQAVRIGWLRDPLLVGTVTASAGLMAVLADLPDSRWWVIASGLATVGIAYQCRIGLLAAPGYLLAIIGTLAVDTNYWLTEPWRLVFLAAPLAVIATLTYWRQSEELATDAWLRWDLGPLVVAHLVAVLAIPLAFATGHVMATGLAFGLLSLALGIARRNRVWFETGNVLLVLAALDAGTGWLTLILGITAVRAAVGAYHTEGPVRLSYHGIGAVTGVMAWMSLLVWQEATLATAVDLSALVAPMFALAVVVAGRYERAKPDSVRIWGGAGVFVTAWAVWSSTLLPNGVESPALGVGVMLLAAATELSYHQTHRFVRHLAPAATLLGWQLLLSGSSMTAETATGITALVFGSVALVVAELTRRNGGDESRIVSVTWGGVALFAVVVSSLGVMRSDAHTSGLLASAGLTLLGLGAARAATPLAIPALRGIAALSWLGSVMTLAWSARWPAENMAVATALSGALATFVYLVLWTKGQVENWRRPLTTLALAANAVAVALAIYVWPGRGLAVAISLSLAAQALAVGVYRDRPGVLAFAPPLTASAFFVALGEGFARNALWYTVPLGVVALCELEIMRGVRRREGKQADNAGTRTVEVLGLGLMVMPALVSMFVGGLGYAGVALIVATTCMVWAGVTRVKRRVVAAAAIALFTTVLAVAAAAAGSAPDSAFFWITGAGIGSAVLFVAGFVEAYRSRKGHLMTRLDRLMEGWE